jgi:hypothetical protein
MVRHPHFTQPIFVRFPRPAVMQGRDGVEQFPQAVEAGLDASVYRSLRPLDPSISLGWVQKFVALYDESEVLKARDATTRARPGNVKAYFEAQFKKIVPPEPAVAAAGASREEARAVRTLPTDDPYGF